MSNIKTRRNKYVTMKTYNMEPDCMLAKHHQPTTNSGGYTDVGEKFISLSASIRRPFSPSYYNPNYKQPHVAGVN